MTAYHAYNDRFFTRLAPFYDLVALPVIPVRRTMLRLAETIPGEHVVDVCTGTGAVALAFARAGCRVTGVDLCRAMLDKGAPRRGTLPYRVAVADGARLPLADGSAAVATIALGLHDMPPRVRRGVLAEMRRVARRALVVMDYEFPRARLLNAAYAGLVRSYETHYFPGFHRVGLREHLAAAGLTVEAHVRSWDGFFGVYRCV